ncbi:hypothetical protein YC2023_011124 [Brassica napus]
MDLENHELSRRHKGDFIYSLRQDNGDQRQSSLLRLSLMTRRRHKVNDDVNRLKEILGTVPPACCMELPYFHGKAAALGDIIGSGRISNRLLSMYLACMVLGLWRCFVVWFLKRSPVLARRKLA